MVIADRQTPAALWMTSCSTSREPSPPSARSRRLTPEQTIEGIDLLGGRAFGQIPINRPHAPVNDTLRDGMHQTAVHAGPAPYRAAGHHPPLGRYFGPPPLATACPERSSQRAW